MREWHHVASALHYNTIAVFQGQDLLLQGRRKVWKSGGGSSNVMGIICPLV